MVLTLILRLCCSAQVADSVSKYPCMGSAPMVLETAIIEPSEVSKRKGKDKQQTDSGEVGSPTILSQH